MEMKKCPSCGRDNLPDMTLCGYCGAKFAAAVPAGESLLTFYELTQEERAALAVNTVKTEPKPIPAKKPAKPKPSPFEDFVIEDGELIRYKGKGGNVVIPKGVTSIGDSAFWGCNSLTSVSIPDGVEGIGERAFARCNSLTSVSIPGSVTFIGDEAFWGCPSLTVRYPADSYAEEYFCKLHNSNITHRKITR